MSESKSTIPIYGELSSGVVGGYVVDKTGVKGLAEIETAMANGDITNAGLNHQTSKIEFKNAQGTKIFEIDAAPFIKDGMLSDVEIKDGDMVFTFNDESINPISIPISEIFNTSNYYNKEEVDAIAEDIRTSASIKVAGGPLADDVTDNWPEAWKDAEGNKVIPAGISLEDALTNLFLKVIEGAVSWSKITWNPTLAAPTITMAQAGTKVEVGTSVTPTVTKNETVNNNTRSSVLSHDYGYFESLDGTWKNQAKTVSKAGSSSGTVVVKKYWNGTETTAASLVVVEGTNTFKADQSGVKASVDALPVTKVYASTNTKAILKEKYAELTDTKPADRDLTSTNNKTVTGSYKYYIGYADKLPDNTSGIKALTTHSGWVSDTINVGGGTAPAGKYMIIAVPDNYSLQGVVNGMDLSILDNFYKEGEKEPVTMDYVLANGSKKSYKIYYNLYGADVVYKSITIKK